MGGKANHLKDRSNTAINSLSMEDQSTLWDSVKNRSYLLSSVRLVTHRKSRRPSSLLSSVPKALQE